MNIKIYQCTRCGWEWATRKERPPKVCPKCKSQYWQIPKGELKMGRPRKKKVGKRG